MIKEEYDISKISVPKEMRTVSPLKVFDSF